VARRFYYECHVFDPRALRYLVEMLGEGQLMFGTATLRAAGLPPDVLGAVTAGNVRRFLRLD
jgi:hypothetical protein